MDKKDISQEQLELRREVSVTMRIGIDLGTTFSLAAYVDEQGYAKIIPNIDGDKATPSVVLFQNEEISVGAEAKMQSTNSPMNSCEFVKRKMGDETFSFYTEKGNAYSAEEISAYILKSIKNDCEEYLGREIDEAVITVPAYFSDAQRMATKDAGEMAGLKVLGLVNEPTAAAIAFCKNNGNRTGNVMVFDLGGGTFDITVISMDGFDNMEVIATGGEKNLGGFDFDNEIINYVCEYFKDKYQIDLTDDEYVMQKLRLDAENAKKTLSRRTSTTIMISVREVRENITITRDQFNKMLAPWLNKAKMCMKIVLRDAGLGWNDIDKVLLVGGSTKVPAIRDMIQDVSGIVPSSDINADEAVAIGAAYYADIISDESAGRKIVDVNSHSLGILAASYEDNRKNVNEIIVPRNTPLPVKMEKNFRTISENCDSIVIEVTEGEDTDPEYVTVIGKSVMNIKSRNKSGIPITVSISYDVDGIVHVFAHDDDLDEYIGETTIERRSNLSRIEVEEKKEKIDASVINGRRPEDKIDNNAKSHNLSEDEIFSELDKLIGLSTVKEKLRGLYKSIKMRELREEKLGVTIEDERLYGFIFSGNPGTGKTTVARLMGEILKNIGLLKKGHLISTDRAGLVGQYQGHTAEKVKEVFESALDGVLFIDEAYGLVNGDNDTFGEEALDMLVKCMTDYPGRIVVVLAGYTEDMKELVKNNIGMARRFPNVIEFPNYTEDELLQIAEFSAKKQYYELSEEAKKAFKTEIGRLMVGKDFGNAGDVNRLIYEAIERKSSSVVLNDMSFEDMTILNECDFGFDSSVTPEMQAQIYLEELDQLIGLSRVKQDVRSLINMSNWQREEKERGKKAGEVGISARFIGNPGTGKTTVARLYGKILKGLGMVKKGQLVEVSSRGQLVGQYQGETALKTREVCEEAYGGILFIDEAYSLIEGEGDTFGKEAVNTLITEIENNRDKLVVILAGYEKELDEFINSNPGFESRVSKKIFFEDYNENELFDIFMLQVRNEELAITDEATDKIKIYIREIYNNKGKNFGNGRVMRNLFDQVKTNMTNRVQDFKLTGDARRLIVAEDIDKLKGEG